MEDKLTYKIKCRGCGKITEMYFGASDMEYKPKFILWAKEHSTFPIEHQCDCDSGSMMFHDVISYIL